MAPRALVLHPDPRLRVVCPPVTDFDAHLAALASDMFDTVYQAQGRGLAAPQVGLTVRMFVTDITWKKGAPDPRVFVNPSVIRASAGQQIFEEACLSIPGQARRLARPAEVMLRFQDLAGRWQEDLFTGPGAAIVQHEADHLDGVLILDRDEVAPPAGTKG
jgi:peptide deformylase